MTGPTRRAFLAACATGSLGLAGCASAPSDRTDTPGGQPTDTWTVPPATASPGRASPSTGTQTGFEFPSDPSAPVDVRGAIYLPARAFNVYQQWRYYDEAVTERDLGYAASVDLNALRTWVSYEFWKEDRRALRRAIDHFLDAAEREGVRVLLGLFEAAGSEPTRRNLTNTDPLTATGVYEPSMQVVGDARQWDQPRAYVRWFMDRYRDDDRLLGIEIMNEPGWSIQKQFAGGMFETLASERGRVPLTVGSTSLANNAYYAGWGLDLLQFHYNFANDRGVYRDLLQQALELQAVAGVPVWLTEWQRIRSGSAFASPVTGDEWQPDYASLAPVIQDAGVGSFFWTLMVQPAYTMIQRKQGVITGLFHEDGAVWSLDDARAIKAMAGDPSFDAEERREWPEWAAEVKEEYRD